MTCCHREQNYIIMAEMQSTQHAQLRVLSTRQDRVLPWQHALSSWPIGKHHSAKCTVRLAAAYQGEQADRLQEVVIGPGHRLALDTLGSVRVWLRVRDL